MEMILGVPYRLDVVKKRLWYAPWLKKVIGIRYNMFFIPLKQPAPASFDKASSKCRRLGLWGCRGRLGSDWSWRKIFENKDRIDEFLKENGGDALPDRVMTEDAEIFDVEGNILNIPQGALKHVKYPYRPLIKDTGI